MAAVTDFERESSKDSNVNLEQKKASAYLWRGYCDNLNITAYNLFSKVNITQIALGTSHSLFLTEDGDVFVNGENVLGQLGLGSPNNRVTEEPIKVEKLPAPCVYIACGSFHNAVVTNTGQVFCWGSSRDGQCGTESLDVVSVPTAVKVEINEGFCQHGVPKPATSVAVSTVACGTSHTLAVSLGGEVWAWGAGPQLGLGELKHAPVPRRVDSLQGQVAIAVTCGGKHSMALVLRQEKSPSRTASPRASPLKGKAEARDVKEDKLYPSRCSTCNKEIYTYTDTNDMCIIDELHSCTISDTAMSIDSTLVEEVSMSSSSASEVLKKSPSPENEGPNDITAQKGSGGTIGDGQDAVEQETVTAQSGSDGTNGDGQHTVEQATSSSLQLKGQGNTDAQEGLVEDSSFSDMSVLDLSVLVVSGESPFDDASNTPIKLPPIPESDVTSSSEVGTTEGADTSKSDGSDEEVWKRQSETDDGDEELKTLYNKQQRVRSPSTTSLRSLNLGKQSEALDYLQRQFEDDKVISQSTRTDSEMTAAAPKVDKTQTSFGNMFDMMAQVKSMTSKAITNIQTYSGFGSSLAEEVTAEKAKSDTELATCVSQLEGPEMKGLPDLKPDQAAKKSGTFIEWSREMATFDDDPSSLTRDLSGKSLRTIEMQQKNLSRSLSSTEILPQAKIITATDVWSWGANDQGQLGLGDQLERSTPALIKYFLGRHVIKLAGGDSHSLAVTANSQVFSWGLNSYGQLGQPETVYGPTKVKFVKGFTPWDIAAGQAHSVFLGDSLDISGSSQLNVMYCGKQPSREQHESMKKTSTAVPLPQIKQLGLITKIAAGGSSCACKILSAAVPSSETIFELAASERAFYAQLIKTTNLLLRPLQKSAFYTVMDVYPYKSSLQNMVSSFGTLTKKIGEGITDLTRCIQSSKPIDQCQMLAGNVQFVEAFRLYSCSFSDFLAIGGFDYCSRAGSEFFEKIQQDSIKDLSSETDKNVGACTLFMRAMRYPFFRLAEYSKFFNKIASTAEKKETKDQIQNVILDWDALKVNFSAEHKLAEATRVFWEISSPKVLDNFKTPNRRVLRDSRTHPLTWPAGGRFAYRLFVLFNDGFLHAQNTGQILMPLETLWVESGASDAEMVNTITVIGPEDRFELQVSTPAHKAEWLIAFNSAISKALTTHKPMTKRNSSGERFTPPLIRTASHKFVKPGIYKDASYEGSWLSGKVHGSGVMKWQDGSVFEGDFKKGLMHGSGVFTLVKSSGQEVQKGQWKDGKLNGKGSISYANGDLYEGYFQDGQRFGHGMLQTGRQRSNCSSVYIGEWLNNMKEGYGVQDDILKGEKYMGMWVEGYRHGSGVLVTLDGMYFEGTFVQNKLTGFGVMISDDNTLYEGDFVGTTYLSGKGVLTLPTGDKLEGNFSGSLNEGLKIHGTFIKSSVSSDGDRKSSLHVGGIKSKYFGRLCVSADNKWEDIFSHIWSTLGQNVVTSSQFQANTDKAWELVAVMVTSGRNTLKAMSGISPTKLKVQQNTLEELAKIPAHGSEKLTVEVVHEISAYLTKAFDTVYHPLGQLMETLVDVFRASYIGIGAHPRLLHHAIQEVMSYVRRLYKVVRVLFPALPANGGPVHVYPQSQMKDIARTTEEAQEFIEGLEVEDPNIFVLTSAGLLYPILLPKIYPPLFDLYALYNEANDDRYWERVTKLNRQSDMGLMAYLGIEQRFWLMDDILQQGKTQKLSTIKDVCYAEAVDALQQLSTAFSPLEKLKIIEQSFNEITKTVTQSLKDDHMWCMDDLFPIFQFVVVRAKIHHLGAEIQIIEDLMEPHLEHGELGLMFTTLKACYFQVQNEKLPHQ